MEKPFYCSRELGIVSWFALTYNGFMELGRDRIVQEILARLESAAGREKAVMVEGTWGSFGSMLVAYISESTGRPILYVRPHIDDADKAGDDLHTFTGKGIEAFGAWEGEEDLADATDEIRAQRLMLVSRISHPATCSDEGAFIVPASIQSLCQPIPKPEAIEAGSLQLEIERQVSPETVVEWLIENGFERTERVDLPGQFARRGGIVDIYAPLVNEIVWQPNVDSVCGEAVPALRSAGILPAPENKGKMPSPHGYGGASSSIGAQALRIEFFGNTIESIREIDLDTLRSSRQIKSIRIVSAVCGTAASQRELFVNILPKDTIIIFEEPGEIEDVAKVYLERAEDPARLYSWADIYKAADHFTQLHICRFATTQPEDFLKVDIKSVQQFQHKATSVWAGHKAALEELLAEAKKGRKVLLYCESSAEIKRVGEIAADIDKKIPARFKLLPGFIHQGFVIDSLDTIIMSHHELFGQYALRRRRRPTRISSPVDTLSDLQEGDYVVHASYGIGRFSGVQTIQEQGGTNEYLTIEYADGVKIQVSVRNIALVQKYIGTSPKRPTLSKVGSKRWQKQKDKVASSVRDLAAELLEVQAKRQGAGGIAFGKDSNWQVEFEESFAYQETPDQTTAAGQIKADMQQAVVMDRLLCGDVGYGKTELAMRAAFKAVENGKQVAVLTPTTVLCVQHGRTFTERFADFPICIEVLNRFKTSKQAKDIIARAKAGRVDVLIGTHRLLSGDVGFKDLGLLIIDEEQRFGVEHKEKLKKLRVNVDILTMTATPIPRTLHMSLLGLRDISSLGTPPLDRRSIVTTVTAYNRELIRKAIYRELNRQGQVFFLHNRVRTIEKKAREIQKLMGDIKITIAHGQMAKSELETAMIEFVTGRTDVLVCTTIIESGLDIPNANTIFINDADRFGLAELHQLRGRVGRYKHRAYAYMLLPMSRTITPLAAKRLKAIEEYSHLGAGFRIALRDLEIRGAGNILGSEQSGHIQTVGYQMYCELLTDAVKKLKNEPVEPIPTAVIDLGFATYIPKNYIPINRHRMDVYRKIAVARTHEDLEQIKSELADVYGSLPDEVGLLLDLAELRIKASRHNIKSIVASGQDLIFSFEKDHSDDEQALFANVSGKVRIPGPKVVYLHLAKNYFETRTLISVLRKMFAKTEK
ncbi:MAG: transcription-repair coupling factor [Planctomycetes bacterium RBG_19FT_COMBO_48_8]|nr:MAG: transcription-repair coupling factor [Planctomycetes bacterium RBG_19FT_COMBO_48_8]